MKLLDLFLILSKVIYVSSKLNPFCFGGILLDTVQRARIFQDSKTFVDMRIKTTIEDVMEKFHVMMNTTNNNPSKNQVKRFVYENYEYGNELEEWNPPDYQVKPAFLDEIDDLVVKDLARSLIRLWPILARKIKEDVLKNPKQYTMFPVPNGFIVPGGRFLETYYWDSYWIINGLMISEMYSTARGIIDNFLVMVQQFGFVPTGNRYYYLDRSQPPLLTHMVFSYIQVTNDYDWLKQNIYLLDKELRFWLKEKTVTFVKNNVVHTLARYQSECSSPRPESYLADLQTASFYSKDAEKRICFNEIRSGAESGWDFTSRWLYTNGELRNLTFISVTNVIPVDLNSILWKGFKVLANFYKILNNTVKEDFWTKKSIQLKNSIDLVLFNETFGVWFDYDLKSSNQRTHFFPSNLSPLWVGLHEEPLSMHSENLVLQYLTSNQVPTYPGGIPSSIEETGEQWDFPNAWAPLQAIVVQGLERSGGIAAKQLARKLAKKWLKSNIRGFMDHQKMFEKYDVVNVGKSGDGGEYIPQWGFGWTNGVALEFIKYYFVDNKEILR